MFLHEPFGPIFQCCLLIVEAMAIEAMARGRKCKGDISTTCTIMTTTICRPRRGVSAGRASGSADAAPIASVPWRHRRESSEPPVRQHRTISEQPWRQRRAVEPKNAGAMLGGDTGIRRRISRGTPQALPAAGMPSLQMAQSRAQMAGDVWLACSGCRTEEQDNLVI